MANTYYDSQLTAAEIEAALEAIDGVIVPANNGKVLAINNGKLEARSVQWGGGGAVVQPLSVTQNGIYNPPSGVDGYAPVTVNVSGGGGYSETIRDYAQFTGDFNGIQLPFYFDENTGIEIEFMLTSATQWQMIFGTWDTGTSGNITWNRATNDTGSSGPLYIGTGTVGGQEGKSVPNLYNTKHTIKTNVNGHSYVDDTIEYSYTPTAPGRQIKNVLGGNMLNGSYANFRGKVYSYKIYNRSTGSLVCDLVPVTITIGNSSFDALKDVINSAYYISSNLETSSTIAVFTCGDDE